MPRKRKHTNPRAPAQRSSAAKGEPQPQGGNAGMLVEQVVGVIEERIEHFSGPLPPPDVLAEYERVAPGSAQTIIDVFKGQSEHRQSLEKTVVEGNSRRSDRGLVLGFIIVLVVLAVGVVLVFNGFETPGTIVLAVPLPTLAGVFVYGKRSQRKEREAKAGVASGSATGQRARTAAGRR